VSKRSGGPNPVHITTITITVAVSCYNFVNAVSGLQLVRQTRTRPFPDPVSFRRFSRVLVDIFSFDSIPAAFACPSLLFSLHHELKPDTRLISSLLDPKRRASDRLQTLCRPAFSCFATFPFASQTGNLVPEPDPALIRTTARPQSVRTST
jgi:hypothetical protein